jgi:NADH:ubiquinone oxidoreductase subunit C
MTNEAIKESVLGILPSATFDESGEFLTVQTDAEQLQPLAKLLRTNEYDYLFCLTCVDWKTHLTTVYHFTSTTHRHTIVIKAKINRDNPEIETVSNFWKTAIFHEREVYEMFGVKFINHPDLRKLILPDDFEGYPMRKDFEDPVNMIKL